MRGVVVRGKGGLSPPLLLFCIGFFAILSPLLQTTTAQSASDCGWSSIEEITCEYYGCCWKSINSSNVGCFNATNDTTTTVQSTSTLQPTSTVLTTGTVKTRTITNTQPATTKQTTPIATTTNKADVSSASATPFFSGSVGTAAGETVVSMSPHAVTNTTDATEVVIPMSSTDAASGATAGETVVSMSHAVTNTTDATEVVIPMSSTDAASGATAAATQTDATTGNAAVNTASGKTDEQETTWESTPSTVTTGAECVPLWANFTGQFVLSGTLYEEFSSSAENCQRGCVDLATDCIAANVFHTDNGSILCFLHSDGNDLTNKFNSPQADLYQLLKPCHVRTTVFPTTTTTTTTTTTQACAAAAWLNTTGSCFNGAIAYPQASSSVDDCLTACSCLVSGCTAAFVRNATDEGGGLQCYVNKQSESHADFWPCPSVTQYVILGNQGSSSTAASSLPPTIDAIGPTTTEKLVELSFCWHPPEVKNADIDLYKDAYGLVAIYTCRQGYAFTYGGTSRTSVCGGNQWTNKVPGCEPVTCDFRTFSDDPTYASSPSSLNSGQVLSSSCPTKSDRFADGCGQESVKCTTASGRMGVPQKQPSGCKGGRCLAPPLITNTTATYNGSAKHLLLTCIPGHQFPDGKSRQSFICNEDGSWPSIPPCGVIFCSELPPPANGDRSTDQVIYGTMVTARCKTGYMFPDHNLTRLFTCIEGSGEDAEWDDQRRDDCQVVTCTNPPTPVASECTWNLSTPTTGSTFYYLDSIQYECLGGRKFSDGVKSKSVFCSANGFWSADEVSCDYNRCDPVPTVDQATPSTLKSLNGSVVCYTCHLGYWFQKNETVECSSCDGRDWSAVDAQQCVEVSCLNLTTAATNAFINSTDNAHGAAVEIRCLEGYRLNKQQVATVECTASGDWSADVTCQPVDCGPSISLMNAIVTLSVTSTTFGSKVTYRCIDGFWFGRNTSSMTATCDVSAQWSVIGVTGAEHWSACTAITCIPLSVSHVVDTTSVALGTVVNVSCPDGQRFAGSKATDIEAICSDFGTWQPDIPDCINKDRVQKATLAVHEARRSSVVAGIAVAMVVIGALVVVAFDWSRLKQAFALFTRNAHISCGR